MTNAFFVSYGTLWVLVIVESIALFALYHQIAEIYINSRAGRAAQGPEIGSQLARILATDLTGLIHHLPSPGKPTVVLLMSTACKPCELLKPQIGDFSVRRSDVQLIVVCEGSPRAVEEWAHDLGGGVPVIADRNAGIAARLGARITPFAIGVGRTGVVQVSGLVNDVRGLEWAADEAIGRVRAAAVAG